MDHPPVQAAGGRYRRLTLMEAIGMLRPLKIIHEYVVAYAVLTLLGAIFLVSDHDWRVSTRFERNRFATRRPSRHPRTQPSVADRCPADIDSASEYRLRHEGGVDGQPVPGCRFTPRAVHPQ